MDPTKSRIAQTVFFHKYYFLDERIWPKAVKKNGSSGADSGQIIVLSSNWIAGPIQDSTPQKQTQYDKPMPTHLFKADASLWNSEFSKEVSCRKVEKQLRKWT